MTGRGLVLAGMLAFAPVAWGQQVIEIPGASATPPDVDPLDRASCEGADGWLSVYKAYLLGWEAARHEGRASPELHQALLKKLLAADTVYAETGDAIALCREMIDTRIKYRF